MPCFDFIPKISQAPSSSVQVLIWEDELDYFKNPSQDFKNSSCLGFLWIPKKTGSQNWRGPIFWRFNLIKLQCAMFQNVGTFFFSSNTLFLLRIIGRIYNKYLCCQAHLAVIGAIVFIKSNLILYFSADYYSNQLICNLKI